MKRLFGAIVLANLGLALFGVVKSPSPSTADTRETNASAVKLIPNTPSPPRLQVPRQILFWQERPRVACWANLSRQLS